MALPCWYEVVTLTRGDEVPMKVWTGTGHVEAMTAALAEQQKPTTIQTYIFRDYDLVWANGSLVPA